MNNLNRILTPFLLAFLLMSLGSCQEKQMAFFSANVPILIPVEDWRNTPFALEASRPLKRMGKTFLHEDLLFVNEVLEGIHIYDNSDPGSPTNLGFLPIHANLEVVAKGNFLYADSYYDLLTFDISNPNQPQLVDRQEDVFPFLFHRQLNSFNPDFPAAAHSTNTHIVQGWKLEEITKERVLDRYCEHPECRDFIFTEATLRGGMLISTAMIGGSQKSGMNQRLVKKNDHLYALGEDRIEVYNIPGIPTFAGSSTKERGDISIQATNDYLWLGSFTKITSYTLANPDYPINTSWWLDHALCSPMVVDGNRVYKSLYTGSPCNDGLDQLHITDISDIHFPAVEATHDLHNPQGLALDQNLLFVGEGSGGLKVYDRTDDLNLLDHLLDHVTSIEPHDVYAEDDIATLTCEDGIYQYDYSNPENLVLLSHISRVASD